jgi:hypothetical protein
MTELRDLFSAGGKYPDLPGRTVRFYARIQRIAQTAPVIPATISVAYTQSEVQQLRDAVIVLRDKLNEVVAAFYEPQNKVG